MAKGGSSHVTAPYEDAKADHVIKDFGGVNTQAGRTSIGENEFAWLENLMPVGFSNLRVVPSAGSSVATLPSGTLSYWKYCNLANVDYLAVFTNDGAGRLMNISTHAFTTVGAPGTFTLPVACAQWENSHLLIVDASNYYAWDGALLLKNGSVLSIDVTDAGSGYTALATVAFSGGGGLGATASVAMMLVGAQTITAAGTGYVVGDVLTLAGGTSSVVAKLRVDTVGGAGDVTAISIYQAGSYTVLPGSPNAVTGGSGAGCTITTKWGVESATITSGGTVSYTAAPTVTFSAGPTTTATGTAALVVGPSGGQSIATFAGRVWVSNMRTISYSAPTSFSDFTEANAGGSFVITDESVHSDVTALVAANNFLYVFSDSAINVISDVRVVAGTPPETLFSNVNVSPIIGSNLPQSIFPYYRALGFATPFGFYSMAGATPQKISDALDGIFSLIDFSEPVTADIALLFNILCMAFSFTYNDPVRGARPLIALFFNKKWFFASQASGIERIVCGFDDAVPTIFGSDGTHVYELFSTTNAAIPTTMVTPLWPMKTPTRTKQALKAGFEVISTTQVAEISVTIDCDNSSIPAVLTADNFVEWAYGSGAAATWANSGGALMDWVVSGLQFFQGDGEGMGRYVGYTVTSTSADFTYAGVLMQYERRANWALRAGSE